MEKTNDLGERTENVEEPVVVKSLKKDVLIPDIPPDVVKEIKDDEDVLVMMGAEIIDAPNELKVEPRSGSGLVSVPTILEEEMRQLVTENAIQQKKEWLEETVKEDRTMDDKAGIAEKEAGSDGEKKEKSAKKEEDGDKKKKEKKVKESREGKKEKDKEEKKKEKKEKKSKKSDVERIQKKLEKIHAKIERILAKKEEYLQRLVEAQEKDRQEKERLAAEEAAKQERELATATKSSRERSGDALPEGEVRDGAEVKEEEPTVETRAKQLDEKISAPISTSKPDTPGKERSFPDEKHPDEKAITD